jgi:hypothetical protein
VTFGTNTENNVPAWVTSKHLRRSTQTRLAYQSSSEVSPTAVADVDTRNSANTLPVHRSITVTIVEISGFWRSSQHVPSRAEADATR